MSDAATLWQWVVGPDPVETVAVLFGVVSVWLSVRQHIWSWPTAMVNVGLYILVFGRIRLYADAGLQVVYLVLSAWGWWNWLHGGADHGRLRVSRASWRELGALAAAVVTCSVGMGYLLATRTDAALPWLDSALTCTSLAAQWLMTRKKVESWMLWVAVDLVYVPMYAERGIPRTAVLYAMFLVLALQGWRQWHLAARAEAGAP